MSDRKLAYLCLQATTEGQASYAHVHEIIAGLKRRGWTVDLFEPAYAGGAAPGALGRLAEFRRVQRRLVRALKTGRYDALYARNHTLAWPAAFAARRLGVPVIQECNGPYDDLYTMWPATRPFWLVLNALTRWQFKHAEAVIAVTPELAAWIERETGRTAEVIGNGANIDIFRPDAPRPEGLELPERYAVFFGALSPWQGLDSVLPAPSDPSWPEGVALAVVGDGALRTEVETAAGSTDQLFFMGHQPYIQTAGIVAGALCSLILADRPGEWGLSPLKLYESMACGVPLVVPDRPGTATTVREHECGVVIDETTPLGVARAVARLAATPDEARAMGARGRAAVEAHYSWDARAAATLDVIVRAAR